MYVLLSSSGCRSRRVVWPESADFELLGEGSRCTLSLGRCRICQPRGPRGVVKSCSRHVTPQLSVAAESAQPSAGGRVEELVATRCSCHAIAGNGPAYSRCRCPKGQVSGPQAIDKFPHPFQVLLLLCRAAAFHRCKSKTKCFRLTTWECDLPW